MSADAPLFQPGEVVEGKYRIVRVIGRGGMGVVYEAHHELLGQPVALKVVLPEIATNTEVLARFMNEARNSAKIESDHVARVMDVGRLQSGAPFMVMDLLVGQDLDAILASEGALPVERVADLMLETLDGVASAHAIGIIHRDLKPANVFLAQKPGRPPRVKVLDFGISKVLGGSPFRGAHVTSTSSIVGSPAYMSPEQLRSSKRVDGRADIWSLGVITYQLVTGVLPYNADNVGALFADILETPAAPPRTLAPSIPPALDLVIMKCLEKKPEDRYPTALELALGLAPFGSKVALRALERIQGLALSSMPAVAAPSVPAIASSQSSPSSRSILSAPSSPSGSSGSSGPARAASIAPEAYAATHISDTHAEARLSAPLPSASFPPAPSAQPPRASEAHGRTVGTWSHGPAPVTAKKMSPLPFLLAGALLAVLVGAILGIRTFGARHGAVAANANAASVLAPSVGAPSVTPSTPIGPTSAAPVPGSIASGAIGASDAGGATPLVPLATTSASATPGKKPGRSSIGKPAPASSEDLFGRY